MIEVQRPHSSGGATPITPKNGDSGSSSPQGRVPTIRALSSGMFIMWKCGKSSGSVPASGRLRL